MAITICNSCGHTCIKGKPTPLGYRNAVLPGYTDTDTGPNTRGDQVSPLTEKQVDLYFQAMQARYMRMMSDQVFDYSHPVDEYGPVGTVGTVVTPDRKSTRLNSSH